MKAETKTRTTTDPKTKRTDAGMLGDAPDVSDRLAFLAGRQRMSAGRPQICPRCGRMAIKPRLHTNALSRHYGIYVCGLCGNQEAMLQSRGRRLRFQDWAAARPDFRVEPEPREGCGR